jgi:hypothetical protein
MTDEPNDKAKAVTTRRSGDAEAVEKHFRVTLDTLPAALAEAITTLSRLAEDMRPDDVCLDLDLPAGVLHFRCWRRAPAPAA